MPRLKNESGSDQSADDVYAVHTRVVKACQRCRLKKCKCDGSTPCTRCISDDAICAYGKHKKSEKIIFHKGYVQMLEYQHTQLIAGLQELYRRTQNGQGWEGLPLDPHNNGQPLTHEILARLGVLCTDEWEDKEDLDGMPSWQSFEQQIQDGSGIVHDDPGIPSPATTMAISPLSISPPAFPQSTIMAKRRSKYENSVSPISETLSIAPFHQYTNNYQSLPSTNDSGYTSDPRDCNSVSHSQISTPMAPFNNACLQNGNFFYGNIEWTLGTDDYFDTSGNLCGLPLQAKA